METEPPQVTMIRGVDQTVGEGRIANRQIIRRCQSCLREVFVSDPLLGEELAGKPCGNTVYINAREGDMAFETLGRKGDE